MPRSRNFAPSDSTCSLTTGRTSKPNVTAPRRRAVAIAWSPATPAPRTSALAGGTVPAAVVSIGRKRGSRSAAISIAWYPATVACEESASIGWARVMRGIDSIAKATTPREASRSIPSRSVSGWRKAIRTCPSCKRPASGSLGFCILTTASAPQAPSPTCAPASTKAESSYVAASPAPGSTRISKPLCTRRSTTSGTRATLRSPGAVSLGTPTFIRSNSMLSPSPRDAPRRNHRPAAPVPARHARVGRDPPARRDGSDRRRGPRRARSFRHRRRDRGRGSRGDHRRQRRLLGRAQVGPRPPPPLEAPRPIRETRPTAIRALLRETRVEDRVLRPLPAHPALHRGLAGRNHANALVDVPALERRRRHLLGDRRRARLLLLRAHRHGRLRPVRLHRRPRRTGVSGHRL